MRRIPIAFSWSRLEAKVRETKVVDPKDTETLFPVAGKDLITLVTCTPLGINTQRILVTGERINPTPKGDLEAAGNKPEVPGFPWWLLVLGGAVLVVAAYLIWMSRPRWYPLYQRRGRNETQST